MDSIGRLNAILEALRTSPRRVNKVFVDRERPSRKLGEIVAEARRKGIPVFPVPRTKLERLDRHHQGAVAFLAAKEFTPLDDLLDAASGRFLVLLDEVEDPQNLGAILRSAEAAGVDGLIVPERRSASLTPAAVEVSAGASEHIKVARVKNLARTMEDLKERGYWLVGAEKDGRGLWYEFDYTLPVALVFGSEGRGLRSLVRERCDRVLSILQRGRVNSLNVSAAAAVFLYEVVRQRSDRGVVPGAGSVGKG